MKKSVFSILSEATLISAPVVAISCATAKEANVQKAEVKEVETNKKDSAAWKNFINQDYIKTILNLVYHNDQNKIAEYIKTQEAINDEQYKELLNWSLFYATSTVSALGSDGSGSVPGFGGFDFSSIFGGGKGDTKPSLLTKASDNVNKLVKDNWLWYLFNLNNFMFTFYSDVDKFDLSTGAAIGDSPQNKQNSVGSIYKPISTKVKQYIIQEYQSTLYYKDYKIYLLTEDGFIMTVLVKGPTGIEEPEEDIDWGDDEDADSGDSSDSGDEDAEDDNSSNNEEGTNTKPKVDFPIFGSGTSAEVTNNSQPAKQPDPFSIEVSQYLYSYPSLALNKKVTEKFDLALYIRATKDFISYHPNRTEQILFEENHGGKQLRFTLGQLIKK